MKVKQCPDYDISNLARVKFKDFDMLMTERFKEFYIPSKFESFTTDLLLNFIKEGDTFIDIGSHYGYYALSASKKIGIGQVHAIEPVRENHAVLKKNIETNNFDNIKAYNIAISDQSGTKNINVTQASDSASFHEHPLTPTIEKRAVKTFRIDDFIDEKRVDIIKIDTEGHELQVLEGMSKTLKENKNIKLFIEFNPKCLNNAGTSPTDLLEKIITFGFDIYFVDDLERKLFRLEEIENWEVLIGEGKEYANILCIKKDDSLLVSFISHSAEMDGAERSLLNIIDFLLKKGVLIHVLLPFEGSLKNELDKRPVSFDVMHFPWWTSTYVADIDNNLDEVVSASVDAAKIIKKINPHFIYSNSSVNALGAFLAKILRKGHIWHITEFGTSAHGINYNLEEAERKGFINDSSDKIVFVSKTLANDYAGFLDKDKFEVVHNSIDIDEDKAKDSHEYYQNSDALKLLILGSIQDGKGIEDAVLAANEVIKTKKSIELLIAGKKRSEIYYEKLKSIIKDNSLEKYVRFIDYIDNPYGLLNQADVVLNCSREEAFGRTTLEAMLLKKPVIGAESGGTIELLKEGVSGLFYKPGDYIELAEKINFFMDNQSKIKELGENGYKLAISEFNEDNTLNKIYKMLKKMKTKKIENHSFSDFLIKGLITTISEKRDMINSLHNQKDDSAKEISRLNDEVEERNHELELIRNSKFWKARDLYRKFKGQVDRSVRVPNVFDLNSADNRRIAELDNLLKVSEMEKGKPGRELAARDHRIGELSANTWKISLDNLLKDKNEAINKLCQEIAVKNQQIAERDQHIKNMKASLFWKVRTISVKVRNIPSHAKRVLKQSFFALKRYGFFGFFRSVIKQLKRTNGRFWRIAEPTDVHYEWTLKNEPFDIVKIKEEVSDTVAFYYDWILKNEKLDLGKIREEISNFSYKPKISILIPVYNVEAKWLNKCLRSVTSQLYENWELCLHDDASSLRETLKCLRQWEAKKDPRIKISYGESNQHISISSNNALKMATGEFIALLDDDDELTPNALFENVKLLNDHPETDMIYSDEDKVDEKGIRFDPFFKPGWTPDYFLSIMYTCHFGVYRKSIVDKIGGFRKGYEGSQDYDLVLRFIEQTSADRINHIPKILYHWRALQSSTASSASSKDYAFEAGKKALSDYLERNQIEGVVESGAAKGLYRIRRNIIGEPLVSIIIPFRDLADVLKTCLDSIEKKTSYRNYEIILIDNQSRESKTARYLKSLEKNEKIKIISYNDVFNYSAINNEAAKKASGDYLLLLNSDIEVINEEWLTAMLEQGQRKEVGVVGAKLIFPDDTIQHAGVIIGIGGIAGHISMGTSEDSLGYFGQLSAVHNYNAVTAACMMVKKDLFLEVNGMDEINLPIAFNDIDFCLKIREKGYLVVFTPFARLYHHESLSRGDDDIFAVTDPLKHQRVIEERKFFKNKWSFYILNDQYYNPNFSLGNDDKIWPSQIAEI